MINSTMNNIPVGYNVKGNNNCFGRTELHSSCNSMFILNTSPSPDYNRLHVDIIFQK